MEVTKYQLDGNNIITIYIEESCHGPSEPETFTVIHQRLINEKIVTINKWFVQSKTYNASIIENLNLFFWKNFIYDYKQGKFLVEQNNWDEITWVYNRRAHYDINFLESYNCFIASFEIKPDDICKCHRSLITDEYSYETFGINERYYGILNIDGTIRQNKLFKGEDLTSIEETITLPRNSSLKDFKADRLQTLIQKNKEEAEKYDQKVSLYRDKDVMDVLNDYSKKTNYING